MRTRRTNPSADSVRADVAEPGSLLLRRSPWLGAVANSHGALSTFWATIPGKLLKSLRITKIQ